MNIQLCDTTSEHLSIVILSLVEKNLSSVILHLAVSPLSTLPVTY